MENYAKVGKTELLAELHELNSRYESYKASTVRLDMTRGKPGADQLDLTMPMLDVLTSKDCLKAEDGTDTRNYGVLDGIPEAKKLFADILTSILPPATVGTIIALYIFIEIFLSIKN